MTTILDWLGNKIECEEIERALIPPNNKTLKNENKSQREIKEAHSLHDKEKREFYSCYVSSLEQIIGFKPEEQLFAEVDGIHNWVELFNWTEREFNHHPFLKEIFNSYAQFFDSFFVHPYGVSYQEGKFVDVLNVEQTKDKDKHKKNQKIIEYVRGINLPLLLYLSVQEHERKHSMLEPLNEIVGKEAIPITHHYREGKSKRKIKGNVRVEFGANYWKNILSSSDDCIFITHDKAKEQLTFRDYWFASLGHLLHPAVYYLNFVADGDKDSKELREHFPYPLFKAILMETNSSQYPLLVEGILGENPHQFKLGSGRFDGVCDFIDLSIWRYFAEKYQKSNPKSELVYFPLHDSRRDKPYWAFDELVKWKYSSQKMSLPKLSLEVVCNQALAKAVSNSGRERPFEFFSEAFTHPNPPDKDKAKNRVRAFVELKGELKCMSANQYTISTKRVYQILKWISLISAGMILATSTINYLSMKFEESGLRQEYQWSYTSVTGREEGKSTKRVIVLDDFSSFFTGKVLPINAAEARKEADRLLDKICFGFSYESGINEQNILTCDIINVGDVLDEGFQDKEYNDAAHERIQVNLKDIVSVRGVTLGAPRPFNLYIPFLRERRDFVKKAGIEITETSGKKYLILPYLPVHNTDIFFMSNLIMNLNTYLYRITHPNDQMEFENKNSPLSCEQLGSPEDAELRSKVKEAATLFVEYRIYKDLEILGNGDEDSSDHISVKPFCVGEKLHYNIIISRGICVKYLAYNNLTPYNCTHGRHIDMNTGEEIELKGERLEDCLHQTTESIKTSKLICSNQFKTDQHSLDNCIRKVEANEVIRCEAHANDTIFTINTQNIRRIIASKLPKFGGMLYIEEREPLRYFYHPIPFEAALQLEQLLKPFEKE